MKSDISLLATQFKKGITPYLFLIPGLCFLGLFFFWPILNTIRYSFYQYDVITPPRFIGLDNYIELAYDQNFISALTNTLKYSLIVVPAMIIIPFFLAMLVNQKLKFAKLFRVVYYLPRILSLTVASLIWKFVFQSDGLINGVLRLLGGSRVGWLTNPSIAIFSIAVVTIWISSGYYMIMYLAGLQSVPNSMIEAARIDGATGPKVLWHIIIPSMRPYILTVALISTIGAMKVFGEVFLMTSGGPGNATDVLTHFIYVRAFDYMKMGYASAAATVLLVILIILSIIYMLVFSRREGV